MAPVSPLLPWEVIEKVIDHAWNHRRSLLNFSLTCHDLRPRALCLLVADVRFDDGREQTFQFCDFLDANPHLRPFVRAMHLSLYEFAPFPLLSIAPNLSKLMFSAHKPIFKPIARVQVLNQSTLTSCKLYGTHIQTLHLMSLSFVSYPDFARLLTAFTGLTDLICDNIIIKAEGLRSPIDVLKRHPPRLCLRTVVIDYDDRNKDHIYEQPSVAALLLDSSGLVRSTVETLVVRTYRPSYDHSHALTAWPRLSSLVFKLDLEVIAQNITEATLFLKNFSLSAQQDVAVELRSSSIPDILNTNKDLSGEAISTLCRELEQTLLMFPQPRIRWLLGYCPFDSTISFWTQELGKHFPVLLQRGAFASVLSADRVVAGVGHCDAVCDLATSPDGKWVATSSMDSTIILWDTANGTHQ